MRLIRLFCAGLLGFALSATALAQLAPTQQHGTWTAKDFRFHTGETMPELRLGYTTLGSPSGEPVLILHGTTGSGRAMMGAAFAGELFGPGQPLDTNKYFVILADALGTGQSGKPSDGLRMKFPAYNTDDMVTAQYRLVTEHFGIRRLRMVLGFSMGGMHTWAWAVKYPDMMDIAVPMAALPLAMSGRNRMTRKLLIESIKSDPEWNNGEYTQQPRSLRLASVVFNISTNLGNQNLQKLAPTAAKADAYVEEALKRPFAGDANDHLYQWDSHRDYDPSANLDRVRAKVLTINALDDERNPPEFGVLEKALPRIPGAQAFNIPASPDTVGHGTAYNARLWKDEVAKVLTATPRGKP